MIKTNVSNYKKLENKKIAKFFSWIYMKLFVNYHVDEKKHWNASQLQGAEVSSNEELYISKLQTDSELLQYLLFPVQLLQLSKTMLSD